MESHIKIAKIEKRKKKKKKQRDEGSSLEKVRREM